MSVTKDNYSHQSAKQFCIDMAAVGLDVEHYQGRNFWKGPAVRVGNLQDALSNTHVPCQWDNMGRGYIVYPKESADLIQARMTEEEFNEKQKDLLSGIPAELHGALSHMAYERSHHSGREEIIGTLTDLVNNLEDSIKTLIQNVKSGKTV